MESPVVVVGGGIIGSAIAYEIQKRGTDTILVERDIEPQGASAFSFASVTAFDEPLRDVYLLKSHGMIGWKRWAEELGDGIGVRWDGEMRWAETELDADHLRHLIWRAAGRGYPVRSIAREMIERRLPGSAPGHVLAACLADMDGQADPRAAIELLHGAFAKLGGTILVGRASLLFDGGRVTVRVGEDETDASTVVIAAGVESAPLLERFGWEIPMDPSPGLLVTTEPIAPVLTGTVYVAPRSGPSVHLRQLPDGRVLIGERAQDEVAKNPTTAHAVALLHQAQKSFPALAGVGVDRFTVEWRPMPRDGMPIVGPLPGFPSLYVAAGHSGVTIAPALAEFVAGEVIEGKPATRLEGFRPTRFGVHQADAYLSIEEAFAAPPEVFIG